MSQRPYPIGTVVIYRLTSKTDPTDTYRAAYQVRRYGGEVAPQFLASDGPLFFAVLELGDGQYTSAEELVIIPFGEEMSAA